MELPKIESDVPIPKKNRGSKYPLLRQMKSGDSIEYPSSESPGWNSAAHLVFGSGNYITEKQGNGKTRLWKK